MKENKSLFAGLKSLGKKLFTFDFSPKTIFIWTGIASSIWFLIRVIPKPSRAGYPCMRAAAPLMSGFVLYLLTLGGSVLLFRRAFSKFKQAKYISSGFALLISVVLIIVFNLNDVRQVYANTFGFTRGVLPDAPNSPMGVGQGIFPGRVAWVWNPAATNENCPNIISNAFFMAKNNNQDTINSMADKSIKSLGGKNTVKDSWDAIFKNFNEKKTGTASAYVAGQKIFIKVNNGQAGWAINLSTLAETGNNSATGVQNAAMSGTTPATVLAIVRQLVDSCNVAQTDIYIGEPMTHVYKSMYDAIHAVYPNVKILDKENKTSLGRTTSAGWTKFDAIVYSDKGADAPNGMPDAITDELMLEMYNADYMINVAALKAHARNGVTLCAKLHFGSHGVRGTSDWSSFHLHDGLICTVDNDVMTSGVRKDYKMYRVLTDIMGHEKLGRNTVLFIVDGLWGGIEATDMPVKWKIAPFNTDFPSSLFMSQDQIALESVCIDFLRAEANINTAFKDRPFFPAVDDYLHQGASKANWPVGLSYDPEGDGSEMPSSLGVHEHWNNSTKKQYTKNIYSTASGIELYSIPASLVSYDNLNPTAVKENSLFSSSVNVYPNPSDIQTEVSYSLEKRGTVEFKVISMGGKTIYSVIDKDVTEGINTHRFNTSAWAKGSYIIVIRHSDGKTSETTTANLMVN